MYILFDIGGSKMRIVASRDLKTIGTPVVVKTPEKFNDGIAEFKRIAQVLTKGEKIEMVAGGIRGILDPTKSKIADHVLKNWSGKPLKTALGQALKSKVIIENDSALVGLGEAVFGAGRGNKIVAYLTISTGVGGARISNGKIDASAVGFEPGNQIIDMHGKHNFEEMVSGSAVEKKYHKKPYKILDKKFWDRMAGILSYGLNNTIVHWSPDIVVLGGSMMKKIGIPVPGVERHLKKVMTAFAPPKVKKAQLEDFGGLYGAMALIRQAKLKK